MYHTVSIAEGDSFIFEPSRAPWSLSVVVAEGGSAEVKISLGDPNSPSTVWVPLESTPITQTKIISFPSPVRAIKVTASTLPCVSEFFE